jgi:hypothetical protein
MVRHKTRWLLARLEFEPDVLGRRDDEGKSRKRQRVEDVGAGLSKKDLAQCIRETISSSFGVAASGVAQDLQGMTISCIFAAKMFANSILNHAHAIVIIHPPYSSIV